MNPHRPKSVDPRLPVPFQNDFNKHFYQPIDMTSTDSRTFMFNSYVPEIHPNYGVVYPITNSSMPNQFVLETHPNSGAAYPYTNFSMPEYFDISVPPPAMPVFYDHSDAYISEPEMLTLEISSHEIHASGCDYIHQKPYPGSNFPLESFSNRGYLNRNSRINDKKFDQSSDSAHANDKSSLRRSQNKEYSDDDIATIDKQPQIKQHVPPQKENHKSQTKNIQTGYTKFCQDQNERNGRHEQRSENPQRDKPLQTQQQKQNNQPTEQSWQQRSQSHQTDRQFSKQEKYEKQTGTQNSKRLKKAGRWKSEEQGKFFFRQVYTRTKLEEHEKDHSQQEYSRRKLEEHEKDHSQQEDSRMKFEKQGKYHSQQEYSRRKLEKQGKDHSQQEYSRRKLEEQEKSHSQQQHSERDRSHTQRHPRDSLRCKPQEEHQQIPQRGRYPENPQCHLKKTSHPRHPQQNLELKQQTSTRNDNLANYTRDGDSTMKNNVPEVRSQTKASPIPEVCPLSSEVCLDNYNSDLHGKIGGDGYSFANSSNPEGFRLLWAGCKANFGVKHGKIFFEVKVLELLEPFPPSIAEEQYPNGVRIGWSNEETGLHLGEEPLSFGYGSLGKFSTNNESQDYGVHYDVGDVIGAMIDLDSDPPTLSFTKNGENQGQVTAISEDYNSSLKMFPHVYTKNYRITVNFGQVVSDWFPPPEGYQYIGRLPLSERIHGLCPPKEKRQCEVIMLIGLPGSGKTMWAVKKLRDNPEKRYNILGTDIILSNIKVNGYGQNSYSAKFEKFYKFAEECYNALICTAARRNGNYILDQTNVFTKKREKTMSAFLGSGFRKIAAVIQPTYKELERRSLKRSEDFNKIVPPDSILQMKKNYTLPTKSIFHEIMYIELEESEVRKLVAGYNKEGCSRW